MITGWHRRWIRLGPAFLVAATAFAGPVSAALAGPASAAPYPPSGGLSISLSSSIVAVGGSIRIHGSGFAPSTKVSVDLHSAPVQLGSPATDESGAFDTVVTIPGSTTPGVHTLSATGTDPSGQSGAASAQITVLPPAATGGVEVLASRLEAGSAGAAGVAPVRLTANQVDALGPDAAGAPAGPLPHTGSGSGVALAIGAAIVVALGSALVVIGRQRRPRRSR